MKKYFYVITFVSNCALGFNNPPYPPQGGNPAYMPPNTAPYPTQNDFSYSQTDRPHQTYSAIYPLTGCNIPPGTYRADLTDTPDTGLFSGTAKLYIQVNDGGLLTMWYKHTEFMGQQELFIITPYRNTHDLSTVCSGNYFNFSFENIKFFHSKLKGQISGSFIASGQSGYLKVNGKIKHLNTQSNTEIKKKLSDIKFKYSYSYHSQ